MDRVDRRCATCKFWFNGGPGADTCMKKLTSLQIRVLDELPASYTVLGGQVHANNGPPVFSKEEGLYVTVK